MPKSIGDSTVSAPRIQRGILLLIIALACAGVAVYGSPLGYVLRLRADPERVPADGETAVMISVEVLDSSGLPAPDGTTVHFLTTLGEIGTPVETVGGVAQTVLRPSAVSGTAIVSAIVGAARETTEVEFLAGAGSAPAGSRMVELTSDDLAYCAKERIFVADGDARLHFQNIGITAAALHYDVMQNTVCAQGEIELAAGSRTVACDALWYDLRTKRGRILRLGDETERLLVEGDRLETRADDAEDECLWSPIETDDARTWVRVQRAIVHPGVKVILDEAVFYVDETPVMSLPRHVLNPALGENVFGNTFGYSSLGGINMDFPFYYHATGTRIGSLHLMCNRSSVGAMSDPGWSLGLKEEYNRDGRREGAVTIEDISDPMRGILWQHRHQLAKGASLNLDANIIDYDDNNEEGQRLRSLSANYYRPTGAGRFSLGTSASIYGESESYFGDATFRWDTARVGHGILVTPSIYVKHSRRQSTEAQTLVDPTTGEVFEIEDSVSGSTTSPGARVAFDLPTRLVGPSAQLNAGMSAGYALSDGDGRSTLNGRLSVMQRFGRTDLVRLGYWYMAGPSSLNQSLFKVGNHRLTLNGNVDLKGYQTRFNLSRELDGGRFYGSFSVQRPLPSWGIDSMKRPIWRLSATHVFSELDDYTLASTVFSLRRSLGRYGISLCYSPEGGSISDSRPWITTSGYGYTYSGGRHLWIEFNSVGF